MLPTIPGVRTVTVGTPADADALVWDLLVSLRFDRLEDVAEYLAHPDHVAFVKRVVTPNAAVRKAWNFTLTG